MDVVHIDRVCANSPRLPPPPPQPLGHRPRTPGTRAPQVKRKDREGGGRGRRDSKGEGIGNLLRREGRPSEEAYSLVFDPGPAVDRSLHGAHKWRLFAVAGNLSYIYLALRALLLRGVGIWT
jgi:hypothetical protein